MISESLFQFIKVHKTCLFRRIPLKKQQWLTSRELEFEFNIEAGRLGIFKVLARN